MAVAPDGTIYNPTPVDSGSSITLTPGTTTLGRLMVVRLSSVGGPITHAGPSGWIQLGTTIYQGSTSAVSFWAKEAVSGDATGTPSYVFSVTNTGRRITASMRRFSGHDPVSFTDGDPFGNQGLSSTPGFTGDLSSIAGDYIIFGGTATCPIGSTAGISGWDDGVTEQADQVSTHGSNANCHGWWADRAVAGIETVGDQTTVLNQGSVNWANLTVLIKAAPAGGGGGGGMYMGFIPIENPPTTPPPSSGIFVPANGAWLGTVPNPSLSQWEDVWTPARTQGYDIIHYYRDFGDYDGATENFPGTAIQGHVDDNRMINVNLKPVTGGTIHRWDQVANGSLDASKLIPIAQNIRDWGQANPGHKAFITLHHEFDQDDYQTFSLIQTNGGVDAMADYIGMWNHFLDVLADEDARQYVIMCWVPSGHRNNIARFHAGYPGDSKVDWLGYQPYRVVCPNSPNGNQFIPDQIGQATVLNTAASYPFYQWATNVGSTVGGTTYRKNQRPDGTDSTKPIMLGETGAGLDEGLTDVTLYNNFFLECKNELKDFTYIKAVLYWSSTTTSFRCHDPDHTTTALANMRSWAADPYWNQARPADVGGGGGGGGSTVRPTLGPEPIPSVNWPPPTANVTNLTGTRTTQFRPDSQSIWKYNLGLLSEGTHAIWNNAPDPNKPSAGAGVQYPIVIDQSGGVGNGTDTWLFGGEINGNDLTLDPRDVQYAHTSGIEHTGNTTTGYLVTDNHITRNIGDAYRYVDKGVAYLKRMWAKDIRDGFVEFDEFTGDAFIWDCLVEGCYSGISDIGSGNNSGKTLTVDGLLLWIKPTVDTPATSGGVWCGGTGGCTELNGVWSDGRYRGTNGIWEGDSNSYGTVIVRNSWFRIDRFSAWGTSPMGWPGQVGAQWNNATNLTIGTNVKVLWTGASRTLDGSGNIQAGSASYPGPALPSGVELVTGDTALSMWDAAAASWKVDHGY